MNARAPGRSRSDLPAEDLHELGEIERLLRRDTRSQAPTVEVGNNGARLSWETEELNAHARGSVTAAVASEVAHTDAWGLSTVHDPMEDGQAVVSLLTLVYDPEEPVEREH